jgi:hypothetical protein
VLETVVSRQQNGRALVPYSRDQPFVLGVLRAVFFAAAFLTGLFVTGLLVTARAWALAAVTLAPVERLDA